MNAKKVSDEQKAKEKLLLVAANLFAEKGFEATTVKDISDASGLNVSLVSYYYKGKEGLYEACVESFAKDKFLISKKLLSVAPKNLDDLRTKLEMYALMVIESYLEQPDVFKIIHRDLDLKNPIIEKVFKETFLKTVDLMIDFFKSAQKQKLVRTDISAIELVTYFYATLMHFCAKADLGQKYFNVSVKNEKQKESLINNFLNFFMKGIEVVATEKASSHKASTNKASTKG